MAPWVLAETGVLLGVVLAGCASGVITERSTSAGQTTSSLEEGSGTARVQGQGTSGVSSASSGGSSGAAAAASSSGGEVPDAGSTASSGGLSYMVGYKLGLQPDGAQVIEGWLGRPLDVAGGTITTTAWIDTAPFVNSDGGYPLLEASFPLLSIFNESNALDDMALAANGGYDATYTAMAQALAAFQNPLLSVRIGWEFNGNWYPWSNGVGKHATYGTYIAAFQRAARIVKQYNPNALIQWCVAWGQPDPTPYWPGAYSSTSNPGGVDVISLDFYQANVSYYNNNGVQSTWAMLDSDATINLSWLTRYAQQQGVKIAFSEYAAGGPGSNGAGSRTGIDDGTWTAAAIQWINSQPPGLFLWANWSDDAPADDLETPGINPKEQQAWIAAWRGTRFAGRWWPGTPPPSQ